MKNELIESVEARFAVLLVGFAVMLVNVVFWFLILRLYMICVDLF